MKAAIKLKTAPDIVFHHAAKSTSALMSKPAAASIALPILIMTISLARTPPPVSIQARYAALLQWNLLAFLACVQRRAIDGERTKQTISWHFSCTPKYTGEFEPKH